MLKVIKFLEAGIIMIVALFAPVHSLMIATAALIVADMITGVIAARKRGESITSAELRRSLSKLLIYELAIMIAFIAETYMSDIMPFIKMVSGMISIVEVKSIYENLNSVSGGVLLKALVDKLGSTNQAP